MALCMPWLRRRFISAVGVLSKRANANRGAGAPDEENVVRGGGTSAARVAQAHALSAHRVRWSFHGHEAPAGNSL